MNRSPFFRSHPAFQLSGKGLLALILSVLPAVMMVASVAGGQEGELSLSPSQLRIQLERVEVKTTAYHELQSRLLKKDKEAESPPSSLHQGVLALLAKGEAKRLHTSLSTVRSPVPSKPMLKFHMKSVREVIYPTEYSPPELPGGFGSSAAPSMDGWQALSGMLRQDIRPHMTAFETRFVGEVVEWQLTALSRGENEQASPEWLRLRIEIENNTHPRNKLWKPVRDRWGAVLMQMPEFEVQRAKITVDLRQRTTTLLSVSPAFDDQGQLDESRNILVFVTAHQVPLDQPLSP